MSKNFHNYLENGELPVHEAGKEHPLAKTDTPYLFPFLKNPSGTIFEDLCLESPEFEKAVLDLLSYTTFEPKRLEETLHLRPLEVQDPNGVAWFAIHDRLLLGVYWNPDANPEELWDPADILLPLPDPVYRKFALSLDVIAQPENLSGVFPDTALDIILLSPYMDHNATCGFHELPSMTLSWLPIWFQSKCIGLIDAKPLMKAYGRFVQILMENLNLEESSDAILEKVLQTCKEEDILQDYLANHADKVAARIEQLQKAKAAAIQQD